MHIFLDLRVKRYSGQTQLGLNGMESLIGDIILLAAQSKNSLYNTFIKKINF